VVCSPGRVNLADDRVPRGPFSGLWPDCSASSWEARGNPDVTASRPASATWRRARPTGPHPGARSSGRISRLTLAGLAEYAAEDVVDRLADGVGVAEVHRDVSGVDKADLAARDGADQSRVEPALALDLRAQQGLGFAHQHRSPEAIGPH